VTTDTLKVDSAGNTINL
jgi:hypothetical protein